MIILVPEVGGDAGVGVLRAIRQLPMSDVRRAKVIGLSGEEFHAANDLLPGMELEVIHRIDEGLNMWAAGYELKNLVDRFKGEKVVALPTGEFFPMLVYQEKLGIEAFVPKYESQYRVSRDKMLLHSMFPFVTPRTYAEWRSDAIFAKPRFGVGSRGCQMVRTREEGEALVTIVGITGALGAEMVFQEYLGGNDSVVDVVNGHAWTRRVLYQRGGADTLFVYEADDRLEGIAKDMAAVLGAPVLNAQFRYRADGKPLVIDIGTRFSGAACCAMARGLNPVALLFGLQEFARPVGGVVRRFEEVACRWCEGDVDAARSRNVQDLALPRKD